jgi:serine/threonine protein kinase/tetratricopeptide (TPR) repeat protein
MNHVILAEPGTLALTGVAILFLLILAALAIVTVLPIIYFLRRKESHETKASSTLSHTQVMHRKCPQCGAELKPDVPEGLCPACLLQRGIATEGGAPPGTPPFTPPPLAELAKLFPQLEILEPIGQGGMGAVYKARQPALDRLVALKILAPRSGGDVDFAERFTREARALAKLSHPNIVAVYDFGQINVGQASSLSPSEGSDVKSETGATPVLHYFIMEYVDGLNLRQIEQAGKLSPHEALQIIPQICAALQFAHDEGIVHRDIKPENILLDKKGRVKIADFGLAKIAGLEVKDFRLTGARDVMGTPHYMAPEQVEHPQAVDHRADIYSLGVVFYEMLTGELPLGKFAPPSQKVQVDVRLDEVVLRSLEKEPSRRYQQASEVKTEVETISSSKPGSKPAVHRKKPILPFILGAGIIFVLLVAAWFIFHGKPAPALTIRAFIDGSDVIKVSGHKLWIEHDTAALPGKTIYINGQAWTPTWTRNASSEFDAVNPAFQPRDPQTIRITKRAGRGIVSIEQFPTADNDQTLAVRINDDDFDGADWYEIVISWDGRPKSGAGNASELTQQGWQLWQSQKLDEAAAKFREAVKLAPNDADAWNGLGWALFNSGQSPEAEKAFQKAVAIEPDQPGALNGLGQIYLSQGKYDQAGTCLLKAAPRAPAAWYGLARLYLLEGNFADAEKWAQKVVDSGQGDEFARQMLEAAQTKHLSEGLRFRIAPSAAANPANDASGSSKSEPAMAAIQAWLKLMDNGDYGKSWEEAADSFHDAVTETEWAGTSERVRQPLGKVLSRKLSSTAQPTTLPGFPEGSYFVAKFDTAFENFKPAVETVTFALADDGQWKAIAYLILPGTNAETSAVTASTDEQAALSAVQTWLKLVDDGDYGQSWETAADSFHAAVTKAEWVAKSREIRQPLGGVLSRQLSNAQQSSTLPGMPDGSYFVAKFDTAFANFKPATETVTFALTDEGQWKAIAYLILPGSNETKPIVGVPEKTAVAAAQKWLEAIDGGHYAESWTDASDYFRSAITQDKWASGLEAVRKPLGSLISRDVKSAQLMTELPGAPDGQYVVMQFETSFANKKTAIETVTFMREKDGQWKAAGYFIK